MSWHLVRCNEIYYFYSDYIYGSNLNASHQILMKFELEELFKELENFRFNKEKQSSDFSGSSYQDSIFLGPFSRNYFGFFAMKISNTHPRDFGIFCLENPHPWIRDYSDIFR